MAVNVCTSPWPRRDGERTLWRALPGRRRIRLCLKGCGALIAAKIISETGGIGRFRDDAQFACLAGVAPIEASSRQQRRHRLSRHGNRQLNSARHKIAVVQGRWDARARVYLERRQAEGKTRREALRALKRHLARVVFRLLREEPGMPPERIKVRGGNVRVSGARLRLRSWC